MQQFIRMFLSIFTFLLLVLLSSQASSKITSITSFEEDLITLDYQSIDLRKALQLLASFSGFNIILDETVQGKLSLHLKNISWQQALNIIVQTQHLVKQTINNGWFVTTKEAWLTQQQREKKIIQQKQAELPLKYKLIPLRYAKAEDVAPLLMHQSNWANQGFIQVSKRSNSLWIQATNNKLNDIEHIVKKLDTVIRQISIEARIVSLDKSKEREWGVRLGLTSPNANAQRRSNDDNSSDSNIPLHVDLPFFGNEKNQTGIHLLKIRKNAFLDLILSSLEEEGTAKVISAPHLVTNDQEEAFIKSGEDIPYQERTTNGDTNIVFKEAVLSLMVVPRVLPNNKLLLKLLVQQNQPSKLMVSGAPAIQKRAIKTQVIVNDGETIILGGIYEDMKNSTQQHVPWLHRLPIIGRLFATHESSYKHSELLIFVTPKLLDNEG